MKYQIKCAKEELKSMFYSDCEPALRNACVGHLRMDFGIGNEFWSTWWENNSDLKTEQFRGELNSVVNELRSSGLLKNRNAMMSYCSHNSNLDLNGSCGFFVETENHFFLLRCQPGEGYDCYCYCYNKQELQQIQSQNQENSQSPEMTL